ncbi:hypothetical protein CDAR_215911 [Caerostris darwini]|uniref:Uncharacterized protein n=1 Tax=Caerostris darwini TaxID=1538125 RepID=A0AAV4NIT5_9ARAC|nr:hypothetical protein CDAR_215911 [Caerostris darwini]
MADPLLFPSSLPNIRRRDVTDFEAPPCRLKIPAFPVTRSGSPPPSSNGHFRTSRCPLTLFPSCHLIFRRRTERAPLCLLFLLST